MTILLVNPQVWTKLDANPYKCPPITLMYLLNHVKSAGYSGKILDLAFTPNYKQYFTQYLRENQFDIIGFTSITLQRFIVRDLIKIAAEIQSESVIVVGGSHFTATANETLKEIPEVDVVVRGEGEITLLKLIEHYKCDKKNKANVKLSDIEGISYRRDDKIFHNLNSAFVGKIEHFSIKDSVYEDLIIPEGKYEQFAKFVNYEKEKSLIVTVGRGCPGRCIFCSSFKKFTHRYKKLESIVSEIIEKQQRYNCNNFIFWDPHFLKRRKFFEKFCNALIEKNISIKWWAETRPDFDVSLLELAKKSGCVSLDVGMESASQKVLDILKKDITIEQVQSVIDKCYELGIKVHVTAMVSMPDETFDDVLKTLKFLSDNSYKLTNIAISPTQILPGTELEEMARKKGLLTKDFRWYDRNAPEINQASDRMLINAPLWIQHFSIESILEIRYRISIISKGLSWDNFKKIIELKPDAKVGVYSAAGATQSFLESLSKEPTRFNIEFLIDKFKTGELNGIPILDIDAAFKREFDFIIVTTFRYYDDVKDLLINKGLEEYKNFAFLYFYEDMIERRIHSLTANTE